MSSDKSQAADQIPTMALGAAGRSGRVGLLGRLTVRARLTVLGTVLAALLIVVAVLAISGFSSVKSAYNNDQVPTQNLNYATLAYEGWQQADDQTNMYVMSNSRNTTSTICKKKLSTGETQSAAVAGRVIGVGSVTAGISCDSSSNMYGICNSISNTGSSCNRRKNTLKSSYTLKTYTICTSRSNTCTNCKKICNTGSSCNKRKNTLKRSCLKSKTGTICTSRSNTSTNCKKI